jgi:hypothetical protein
MNGNNIDKLSSKVYIRISITELQISCIIIMINSIINRITISVLMNKIVNINRVKLTFFYKLNKN